MLVTALKGLKVVDVACGSGDAQTLAVTENGKKTSHRSLVTNHSDCCGVELFTLYMFPQVRSGPGGMETTANWAEEAATAVKHPSSWRNCRTWT